MSTAPLSLPPPERLTESALLNTAVRKYALDNVVRFKRMHGGLGLVEANSLEFDPRADYWRRPERRIAVTYLSNTWNGRCTPTALVREHALLVTQHLDRLRSERGFRPFGVNYAELGGWDAICQQLVQHAGELGPVAGWEKLQQVWRIHEPTAAAHLVQYLQSTLGRVDGPKADEAAFQRRAGWFPYLGALSQEDLARRQRFFYGYVNLLTSTNAYMYGGASQQFASVIQNTPFGTIRGLVRQWQNFGQSPVQTGFPSLNGSDVTPQERKHHSVVKELFGFLCLDRLPFVNGVTQQAYCTAAGTTETYAAMEHAGKTNRAWLAGDAGRVASLSGQFDQMWIDAVVPTAKLVHFETVDRQADFARAGDSPSSLIDGTLSKALIASADRVRSSVSPEQKAMCALHLLADAWLLENPDKHAAVIVDPQPTPPITTKPAVVVAVEPPAPSLVLPPGLKQPGELALAYLGAGAHVLFAGAPGTGKTTVAQFVADAWNQKKDQLASSLPRSALPTTVVAHSGWSPFHTVGGLVPGSDGKWQQAPGIFVEKTDAGWRLLNSALVLDEMNRADLDRSIGDLYPLLSNSVSEVRPAGIPGVDALRLSERFRIIATVNDATLDDIVYPISEGLARRFVRIELPGASEDDVAAFVCDASPESDRRDAAREVIATLYREAATRKFSLRDGEIERMPFGAGYFGLLRSWVLGELVMPPTLVPPALWATAYGILCAGLATAIRPHKALREVLNALTPAIDD